MEKWKPAPGLNGLYEISDFGRFRRVGSSKVRKLTPDKNGYLTCVAYLGEKGDIRCVKMHRLVVGAFIEEIPDGLVVNHKNGVKNDNRPKNLEIVSISQNTEHGFRVLGRKGINTNPSRGESHHHSRFTEDDIREIRALYRNEITQVEIARRFRTRQSKISEIVLRKAWKHVT